MTKEYVRWFSSYSTFVKSFVLIRFEIKWISFSYLFDCRCHERLIQMITNRLSSRKSSHACVKCLFPFVFHQTSSDWLDLLTEAGFYFHDIGINRKKKERRLFSLSGFHQFEIFSMFTNQGRILSRKISTEWINIRCYCYCLIKS